ncbi:MAG: hypothetical protein JNG84_06840 [Archangium sp.]|nr:hypothetical protein [Archangium sp.]
MKAAWLGVVVFAACQRDVPSPPPATTPTAPAPMVHRGKKIGPLVVSIPEGFSVVDEMPRSLLLRHSSDLTATLGVSMRGSPLQDEQSIMAFLTDAETNLKKIENGTVTRVVRMLPGTKRPLRGLVAFTTDTTVKPPTKEKREFWVLTDAPVIVTASFIYVEGDSTSAAALEKVLAGVGDAVVAYEATK